MCKPKSANNKIVTNNNNSKNHIYQKILWQIPTKYHKGTTMKIHEGFHIEKFPLKRIKTSEDV